MGVKAAPEPGVRNAPTPSRRPRPAPCGPHARAHFMCTLRPLTASFCRPPMAPAPPHTWAGVVGEWAAALRRAPQLLATVALRRRSLEDELVAASLRGHLRRALAWWDLLALGVGQAVASGIFTQSGVAANTAGPAVVLSFAFSGAAAAAAAACYAEFAADFPVAGAGLTYTIITLGEAPGEAIEVVPGLRRAHGDAAAVGGGAGGCLHHHRRVRACAPSSSWLGAW